MLNKLIDITLTVVIKPPLSTESILNALKKLIKTLLEFPINKSPNDRRICFNESAIC